MQTQPCQNPRCDGHAGGWQRLFRKPKGVWLNNSWYCSMTCFEDGAEDLFAHFSLRADQGRSTRYRLPLGLLLLSKGLISAQHLQEALMAQRESQKGRLGEWLRHKGFVTEDQVTAALGVQWGLPVFHLTESAGFTECAMMAPLRIMEGSRMALVHYMPVSRKLYVAFSDGIDFAALRALEQVLECDTQPCVIGETEMAEALDKVRQMPRPAETVIDCPGSPRELAQTTRQWLESNRSERVRVAPSSEYIWLRIESGDRAGHLLFQLLALQPELVP